MNQYGAHKCRERFKKKTNKIHKYISAILLIAITMTDEINFSINITLTN